MGQPITPSLRVEAPAIGAAILAALATGLFDSAATALAVVLELAPPVHPRVVDSAQYTSLREQWETIRGRVFPTLAPLPVGATSR